MTPDDPFLKALLADPEDDTLRLAMADWLDENGDAPRAEFIRVQIELARGVANIVCRRELEVRQSKLLFAHDGEWVAPLAKVLGCKPGRWGGWVFRRGFVEYFRLGAHRAARRGFQLGNLTPVRELNLEYRDSRDNQADMTGVWQQLWVQSLTHIHNLRLDVRMAEALIGMPPPKCLRELTVFGDLPDRVWARFAEHFTGVLKTG